MIELHSWTTPNGHKIHIMLEETGLPYEVHPVDIGAGAQFDPAFLAISPNNKIPAIVDREGPGGRPISIFESGAILLYLAEKTGKLLPGEPHARWAAVEWLMFQMGSVGPMFGQYGHFNNYAPEKIPYAIERYTNEVGRLYRVLERRLAAAPYLAGGEYSIADIAVWPWVRSNSKKGEKLAADLPSVRRWYAAIDERPGVKRGLAVLSDRQRTGPMDDKAREILFGKKQYEAR
jgi:GSH-dependent disulfide-bond oxidoreductase